MKQAGQNKTEAQILSAFCASHLHQVLTNHNDIFNRYLDLVELPELQFAELFEDAANMYLNCSEEISARHRRNRETLNSRFLPTGYEGSVSPPD